MKTTTRKTSRLKLDEQNAKRHTDEDVDAIARSLKRSGQQTPIVITKAGVVIKGNGTLLAARKLGWTDIETVTTTLEGNALRAYAIADNKTGQLSTWDTEKLVEQINQLADSHTAAELGFSELEIHEYLSDYEEIEDYEEDINGAIDNLEGTTKKIQLDIPKAKYDNTTRILQKLMAATGTTSNSDAVLHVLAEWRATDEGRAA